MGWRPGECHPQGVMLGRVGVAARICPGQSLQMLPIPSSLSSVPGPHLAPHVQHEGPEQS